MTLCKIDEERMERINTAIRRNINLNWVWSNVSGTAHKQKGGHCVWSTVYEEKNSRKWYYRHIETDNVDQSFRSFLELWFLLWNRILLNKKREEFWTNEIKLPF